MSHLSVGVELYNACLVALAATLCQRRELVRKVEKDRGKEKEKDNREQAGKTQNRLRERREKHEREGQA